jgi:hypothetical protein
MNKEQLLQAILHNAQATIQFAKDSEDIQLEAIGHATMIALISFHRGHLGELMDILSDFVASKSVFQGDDEIQKKENELQKILNSAGIHIQN